MRLFAVAAMIALMLSAPLRAGIYSANEPFLFEIDADGYAKPVQFAGGYENVLAGVRQAAQRPQYPGEEPNPERAKFEKRVKDLQAKTSTLKPEELAGYTADLIRLNRNEEALNLLQPIARDRQRGGFLAYAHLARAHAGRGDWKDAFDQHQMAIRYSDFPTTFAKLTKPQLAWLKRVEKDYYLPFLAHRAEESRHRRPADLREDVDALFPPTPPPKRNESPVRFIGEDGQYVVGSIAAAEQKKLPPDALAIVQQLVLWHPQDARLYWLLGELYNAAGEVDTAANILDLTTFTMSYSNPNVIEHKRVLKAAVDEAAAARAAEREQQAQAERDRQRRFWWILSLGVALGLLLVYYQFREVFRRLRRGRGQSIGHAR